jgi:hypothetical protein
MKATGKEIKDFFDAGLIDGYGDGYDGLEIYDEFSDPPLFLLDTEKVYDLDKDFGWIYAELNADSSDFLFPPIRFSEGFRLWKSKFP